jgi:hypothetical protein
MLARDEVSTLGGIVRKTLRRSALLGILLGIGLYFIAVRPRIRLHLHFSRMNVYDSIYAGMTREEAEEVLAPAGINCGLTSPRWPANFCEFSDFWHIYEFHFDSNGRVRYKFRKARNAPFQD